MRILEANVDGLEVLSPRRYLHPARVLPKPAGAIPELFGVRASYETIHNLRIHEGRFLPKADDDASASVCVLGVNAKVNLLGYDLAVGKQVKVNDTWLQVVGVLAEQVSEGGSGGGRAIDRNNAIFIPANTFRYRFWDSSSFLKDDLDGVDLRLRDGVDSVAVAKVVTAILNSHPPQHRRLQRHHPRRAARAAEADADHLHLRDGGDRGHLAAGWRHRDHEHRAGDGDGAHA